MQNVHSKTYHCGEQCFAQSWREWMRNRMANGGRDEHEGVPLWKPPGGTTSLHHQNSGSDYHHSAHRGPHGTACYILLATSSNAL